MLSYSIREMTLQDAQSVSGLEASCFSMPWKYKDFADIPNNKDRVYLVAESSDIAVLTTIMTARQNIPYKL